MKFIESIIIIASLSTLILGCKENQHINETHGEETVALSKEKETVIQTMKSYKDALQNLTTNGTFELFADDAKVFEQGKAEGTYKNYIDHHLGPELGHFKSFNFSNYQIEAAINLPYAFTTETYNYTIVIKANEDKNTKERTIESKGVSTSVLKKVDGTWKIINSHSSFKKLK